MWLKDKGKESVFPRATGEEEEAKTTVFGRC